MIGGANQAAWARRWLPPVAALGLHALFAIVLFHPARPRTAPSPENRLVDIVTVEEAPPENPAGAPVVPRAEPSPAAAAADRAASARTGAPIAAAAREERALEKADPTAQVDRGPAASSAEAPEGAIGIMDPRAIDLGIGAKNPFSPTSAAAVDAAEAKRAVDHALREPAREKERELGLGPEGPVLTALADATARSVAPVRGRAVFVATSNGAGDVVSLELADAEGGRPGWADAARIALAGLVGKKLRVAPGSTRAVMRIEVVSAWKLPSGQDPGTDLTLFHIPISKGEGKDSAKVSILDPIPKFRVDYIEISPGVKVPLVSIQMNLLHGNTDPSNVGARPRRVVHTRLLDSKVM